MQNLKVHTSKDLLESTQFSFTKCGHLHILGKQTGNTSNFMALSESVFCPRSILSLKKWLPLVLNLDCIIEIPGKLKQNNSIPLKFLFHSSGGLFFLFHVIFSTYMDYDFIT